MNTLFLAVAGLASAMLAVVPATAAPGLANDDVTRAVSLNGIDLSNDAGVDLLNRRIDQAVNSICGHEEARNLRQNAAVRNCRTAARASTISQMQLAVADARRRNAFADQGIASFAAK